MSRSLTYRLKGFTILELLIVMVISSLLVGAGMMAMQYSTQQQIMFQNSSSRWNELTEFRTRLLLDAELANKWEVVNRRGVSFLSTDEQVEWDFGKHESVRQQGKDKQYYDVTVDQVEMLIDGQEKQVRGKLVDKIKLEVYTPTGDFDIVLAKQYGFVE